MKAHDRLLDLERQVAEVMRGNVLVAARADGAAVVTADAHPRAGPCASCSVSCAGSSLRQLLGAELRGSRWSSPAASASPISTYPRRIVRGRQRRHPQRRSDPPQTSLIVGDTQQYRAFRRGLHVGADRSWLGVPMIDGQRWPECSPSTDGARLLLRRPRPDRHRLRLARGPRILDSEAIAGELAG